MKHKIVDIYIFFVIVVSAFFILSLSICHTSLAANVPDVTISIGIPDSGEIKALLGVNAGPMHTPGMDTNKDLTQEYRDYGVRLVRTHDFYGPFDMSVIYPDRTKNPDDPASYNFTDSDKYFTEILNAGCEPYFRIGDSYNNVDPPTSSELDNWVKAAVNVIQHFRNGKWNGFNSTFRYVEIGNEPDYEQFWPSEFSMLYFFQLFDKTAQAMRASFPDIKIGGPGFTQNVNMKDSSKQILRDFLSYISGKGTPIDFISCHHYTNDPNDITTGLSSMRQILTEKGYASLPIHNTEWNNDTNDKTAIEQADLRINSKGAAIDASIWIAFQKSGVAEAFFFRGNDTNITFPTFYGLFKADGTPKKSALAFKIFKYFSDYTTRLQFSQDVQKDGLWILAGKKNDGKTAILLANISSGPIKYSFSSGSRPSKILEVSDEHSDIYSFTSISDVTELKQDSIHFVEIDNTVTFSSFSIGGDGQIQQGVAASVSVNASSSSGAPLYYKFFYCANYGTADYSSTPWTVIQDYSTNNMASCAFPQAGNYVLVVRAVTDQQDEPVALPLIGTSINAGAGNGIMLKSLTSDKTGTIEKGENIKITASAQSSDGRPIYYKFYYCGNYGTDIYASTPWTVAQEYSTNNQALYNFQDPGNYVVVVRAVTDPYQEPAALPIIGATFSVR